MVYTRRFQAMTFQQDAVTFRHEAGVKKATANTADFMLVYETSRSIV